MDILERREQIAASEQALADVENRSGRAVIVSGEAGIGKTTLVNRFCLEKQGRAVLLGSTCDASFTRAR
jgi:predicted ATPase